MEEREKKGEKQDANLEEYEPLGLIGKNIDIVVSKNEVVDAAHLQQVLDGEIQKDYIYFDMWNDASLERLIAYMLDHDYTIAPGRYTINQAWGFDDGELVLPSGERTEVFKFK